LHTERVTAARFQTVSFFNLFRFPVAFVMRRPPVEAVRYHQG
jgi:hypothetical protein